MAAENEPTAVAEEPAEEESQNPFFDAFFNSHQEEESKPREEPKRGRNVSDLFNGYGEDEEEPAESDPAKDGDEEEEQPENKREKPKPKVRKDYSPPKPKEEDRARPAPPPPPPPPKKRESQNSPLPEGLSEDEQDEYELAVYASEKFPDQHKDFPKKLSEYFRKKQDFIRKQQDEDPEFNEEDPEFQRWDRQNRPQISRREMRKIERSQILDEAEGKVRKDLYDPVQKEIQRIRSEPLASGLKQSFRAQLHEITPKGVIEAIQRGGPREASEEMPVEYEISVEVGRKVISLADSLINVSHNQIDQAPPDLVKFVQAESDRFAKHGGNARVKGGKHFVPLNEFTKLSADEREKAWTWNTQDYLNLIKERGKQAIQKRIAQEHQRLEKAGYVRKPAASPKPRASGEREPVRSAPRVKPSPSSSGTQASSGKTSFEQLSESLYDKPPQ
jgi:hypothetical protein